MPAPAKNPRQPVQTGEPLRPDARGRCGAEDLQIWRVSLRVSPARENRLLDFLGPEEHQQARRFHFPRDRRRFVVRRAVLRQLLARELDVIPSLISLVSNAHGKPAVGGQTGAGGLRFNASHSGDWALIALCRGSELGVDLEQHRALPDASELARTYFSATEIREFNQLPESQRQVGFYQAWTRKEAFVKALGCGLSLPLSSFSVSLTPNQPALIREVKFNSTIRETWKLVSLSILPNYSAALVYHGKNRAFKYFDW